eukprot:TRINITY_DN3772_c0_g1_i2.p1 TRINITY_DN3772_c0_g1~~TRINITY_DN3772_c0_g1_i2.p1  ORF type:complete len:158 (-),score=12.92 TRINITY_DN3772_c0_g1_i2:136-609(-)
MCIRDRYQRRVRAPTINVMMLTRFILVMFMVGTGAVFSFAETTEQNYATEEEKEFGGKFYLCNGSTDCSRCAVSTQHVCRHTGFKKGYICISKENQELHGWNSQFFMNFFEACTKGEGNAFHSPENFFIFQCLTLAFFVLAISLVRRRKAKKLRFIT